MIDTIKNIIDEYIINDYKINDYYNLKDYSKTKKDILLKDLDCFTTLYKKYNNINLLLFILIIKENINIISEIEKNKEKKEVINYIKQVKNKIFLEIKKGVKYD